MSHNINVAITKTNPALTEALQDNNFLFAEFNGWLVISAYKGIRKTIAQHNKFVVFANTNYFGGCGNQSARFINLQSRQEERFKSINNALEKLGVVKTVTTDYDLYEFVGLGKIRENEDLVKFSNHTESNQFKINGQNVDKIDEFCGLTVYELSNDEDGLDQTTVTHYFVNEKGDVVKELTILGYSIQDHVTVDAAYN